MLMASISFASPAARVAVKADARAALSSLSSSKASPAGRCPAPPRARGAARSMVMCAAAGGREAQAQDHLSRRELAVAVGAVAAGALASSPAALADTLSMPGLEGKGFGKAETIYPDYERTASGLQYQDLRKGEGEGVAPGQKVTVDWDGYTIGYYGRIIQAKNLAKGGAFEGNDTEFLRFKLGAGEVIPAFEEAVAGMKVGGVRRIIVSPGALGYPEDPSRPGTLTFKEVGPKPSTFSGKRSLDFVLRDTGLMDKTLLFDIELMDVKKSGQVRRGAGTWIKGPQATK